MFLEGGRVLSGSGQLGLREGNPPDGFLTPQLGRRSLRLRGVPDVVEKALVLRHYYCRILQESVPVLAAAPFAVTLDSLSLG